MKNNNRNNRLGYRGNQISWGTNLLLSLVLTVLAIVIVLPLVLVISISFSTTEDIARNGYQFIPAHISFNAYEILFKMGYTLLRSYLMTIFYTVVGTVFSLFVTSMFAFVLARQDYPYRKFLAFFAYFTTLFSGGLVPQYVLRVRYLHIDNTVWVFLLPSLVSAFHVIILRTFIRSNIPDALFDSAKIDGANEWKVYTRIVMPLLKPGLATLGLFNVVNRWNDWFTGTLYVQDRNLKPVMTVLQNLQKQIDYLKNDPLIANSPEGIALAAQLPSESARMAITILVSLPLLIAYPFFQKYFIKGMTIGSVKE